MAQRPASDIPEPLASNLGAVEGLCHRYHVARLALLHMLEACDRTARLVEDRLWTMASIDIPALRGGLKSLLDAMPEG